MSSLQYPVSLDVEDELCLVVGGGAVAARKAAELVACGAEVWVIAPRISDSMARLESEGAVRIDRREVRREDLEDPFLVVVATDDPEVNDWAAKRARRAKALVNVVDQPDLCQFTAPAVLRRGSLTVAISTGGASPALAGRIRDELGEILGPEWEAIMDRLAAWRQTLQERYPDDAGLRRELMLAVTTLDLVDLARRGGRQGLDDELERLLADTLSARGRG